MELKKTTLGAGSKANHLSYLGNATIGANVNVGAGTITCNYDGQKKYDTVIEDGAFIGSDTQLIAPVRIGKGAYIGRIVHHRRRAARSAGIARAGSPTSKDGRAQESNAPATERRKQLGSRNSERGTNTMCGSWYIG